MNFTIQENPTEIKPCIQQVQEQIFVDKNGVYRIPSDLKIADFPESVVNAFLDFMNQFSDPLRAYYLQKIKEGEVTVVCDED